MLQDALWTTLYSEEQIRLIEEQDKLDKSVQNAIDNLLLDADEVNLFLAGYHL